MSAPGGRRGAHLIVLAVVLGVGSSALAGLRLLDAPTADAAATASPGQPSMRRELERVVATLVVVASVGLTVSGLGLLRAQRRDRTEGRADVRDMDQVRRATAALLHREEAAREEAEALLHMGRSLSAELEGRRLLEEIVGAARRLFRAEIGAFVHSPGAVAEDEALVLSGAVASPHGLFRSLPRLRDTALLEPTFRGEGIVMCEDITRDPRHGGLAAAAAEVARPEVRSYLAVPVVSRSGEVLGGLFFGHSRAGGFTERDALLAVGVAAQAAIALDNARLYRRAQEAISIRDSFLSIASHELKTPLTALQLHIDGLLRALDRDGAEALDPERLRRRLTSVDRQSRRLAALVDELLDVSRVAEGRLSLSLEEVHLDGLLGELAARFELELARSACSLAIVGDADVTGRWDRSRLDQVLTNVLANAIKYGPGKPITMAIQRRDHDVSIHVTDQGMGIELKDQARIFQRFERAVPDRQYGGFGLGLWISRQIVHALGGSIHLRSRPGEGSTFEVRLPLAGFSVSGTAVAKAERDRPAMEESHRLVREVS